MSWTPMGKPSEEMKWHGEAGKPARLSHCAWRMVRDSQWLAPVSFAVTEGGCRGDGDKRTGTSWHRVEDAGAFKVARGAFGDEILYGHGCFFRAACR